ncbi:hypothetical protein J4429_03480 [Candidatus Pacearchaeota archaeon]|nr:hypothetical protein [Candidatus Pacearchaeota archaeon]
MRLIYLFRITQEGRSRDLRNLKGGDNLTRLGITDIVESVEEHKGLYVINTMRILKHGDTRTKRAAYSATKGMLRQGYLYPGMTECPLATTNEIEFYHQHLIQQPMEVTA